MEPIPQKEREGLIYLNNAATSWPKPPDVIAEVTKSLQNPYFDQGRTTAGGAIDYPTGVCRNKITKGIEESLKAKMKIRGAPTVTEAHE